MSHETFNYIHICRKRIPLDLYTPLTHSYEGGVHAIIHVLNSELVSRFDGSFRTSYDFKRNLVK